MLEIKDVHVEINGIEVVKGVSLKFEAGKIHALMGPNGSGKSSLANAIAGHPKYKITKGQILLNGKDVTHVKPHLRAREGIFLSFQYPQEINGVTIGNLLRTAYNTVKGKNIPIIEFNKMLKEKMNDLHMDAKFAQRELNVGFSGGEKKRAEMVQLRMLEPKYAILDETDSGMDVDAIKIVAEGIKNLQEKTKTSFIIITHYSKFLKFLSPDDVSIMYKGEIVAHGSHDLAKQIEEKGFEGVINAYEGTTH